jgi:hypothetical protein
VLFGPDRVVSCPRCGALERVFTLRSSNNLFCSRWTDGLILMGMAWEPPDAVRCHACQGYYLLRDAADIGMMREEEEGIARMFQEEPTVPGPEDPKEWQEVPNVRGLSMEEAIEAIAAGLAANAREEIHLRTHAFWGSSQKNRNWRRKKTRQKTPFDKRNMVALLALHTRCFESAGDPVDAIAAAELERQSGNFEACLAWLGRVKVTGWPEERGRIIRERAEASDIAVANVPRQGREGRRRPEPARELLVKGTRTLSDGAVSYSAYFPSTVDREGVAFHAMVEFGRVVGAAVVVVDDGKPFVGMAFHLEIEPLTDEEVEGFRKRFTPPFDSAIPGL